MPGQLRKYQQKNSKHYGQSLIEIALLLPLLLVLIVGALEFGRLFFTKIVITNAAREAAYYLSTHPGEFENATTAAEAEAANSGISGITVTPTAKDLGDYSSIEITVETTVNDLFILRLFGNALTATNFEAYPLSSTVEMMVQ